MSQSAIDWSHETMAARWERIIKVENLQADTMLKQAQTKVVAWQVVVGSFTAGAAVVGAIAVIGHWL